MKTGCRLFILATIFLAVLTATAVSQDNNATTSGRGRHHRPMDVDSELAHLTKELSLTSAQQDQIRPILVEHQQKEQALRQDHSLSPEELRTRSHAISDDTHKQIETLLNDEQKQKAKAMQQRMHRHDPNGSPAPSSAPSQPMGVADPRLEIASAARPGLDQSLFQSLPTLAR